MRGLLKETGRCSRGSACHFFHKGRQEAIHDLFAVSPVDVLCGHLHFALRWEDIVRKEKCVSQVLGLLPVFDSLSDSVVDLLGVEELLFPTMKDIEGGQR